MTDSSSYIDALQRLQTCLVEQDCLEEALELVKELKTNESTPPSLAPILDETQLKLWLHLEQFQELTECNNFPLQAYAHYRLHQYKQAKNICQNEEDLLSQLVLAQCLYRLHDASALDVYKNVLSSIQDEDEVLQVQTNALAVAAAHAIPYVQNDVVVKDFTTTTSSTNSDYLYNLATYQILTGNTHIGQGMLQQAREQCQDEADMATIDVQLHEWSMLFNGRNPQALETKNLPPAVSAVHHANQATASLKAPPPAHWTTLQQRLYYYKRAILQFQAQQYKECKETCQLLQKSLATSKHNAPPPACSPQEEAWWRARITVLEAHVLNQQNKSAVKLLEDTMETLQSMESSSVLDHAVAYLQLHLFQIQHEEPSPQDTIDMLQSLPESIQRSKAVTATLVSLYQQLGDTEKATQLLSQGGDMADYYMSIGEYEQAVELLEAEGNDPAKLVVALSYTNPERAQQLWTELNIEDEEGLNGEELEAMDLPRFKSKKTAAAPSTESSTTKRSKESILKQRARKRDKYLQQHNIPPTQKPDPERWLPKYERSYYKRRGRHGRGAQGGASTKEAAKLDVAARASGQHDVGPSTAHMGVSSGKRSGRRR